MEIQIIRKELPKKLDKALAYTRSFIEVAEDGMIARFLGFYSIPQVNLPLCLLEINGIEYAVSIWRFKNIPVETLCDFRKLADSELVVRKDGDKFYFELA